VKVACIVASLSCRILALVIGVSSRSTITQSVAWSELSIPLSVDGHYTLVIGIASGSCPASVYQTYGASGCEPFAKPSCARICPYIVYRTSEGEQEW